MPDGTPVALFTLTNAKGMEVRAIGYGAILVSVKVPDRRGDSPTSSSATTRWKAT